MPKALVLSGGGSKGAWQLGILKRWMKDERHDYEILAGVSVGALTVAGIAPYGRPEEAIDNVIKLWLDKVETKNIYKRWYPFGRLHALWRKSVYDSQPLIDLVYENFDHEKVLLTSDLWASHKWNVNLIGSHVNCLTQRGHTLDSSIAPQFSLNLDRFQKDRKAG